MAKPGRRGIRALRRVLAQRRPDGAPTESVRETMRLDVLRRAGLPEPRVQYEVRDEQGSLLARVDAAYPAQRIALEYDSYLHHGGRTKYVRDLARRNVLTAAGWRVIHAAAPDLRNGGSAVCDALRALLRSPA
jgi:very-short-patch-repair endonuclease